MNLQYQHRFFLSILVLLPILFCSILVNSFYSSHQENKYVDNTKYLKKEIKKIKQTEPDIVLMGNSMLEEGIDVSLLNKYLNAKFHKFAIPGSASASWYLMLKNIIIAAEPSPQTVVLFFRDPFITHAKYRTSGKYEKNILKFASPNEPLVAELVYGDMSQKTLGKLPIYGYKNKISEDVTTAIKEISATSLGLNVKQLDKTLKTSFAAEKTRQTEVTKAQEVAESYTAFSPDEFDFQKKLSQSFLPAIVALAQENEINLILVRVRKRDAAKGKELPANVVNYIKAMDNYLEKEDITLLDLSLIHI